MSAAPAAAPVNPQKAAVNGKPGVEGETKAQVHKLRITLTSTNVKSIEKVQQLSKFGILFKILTT